ncbi:PREDICTED: uncharacterized protein LOC108566309 [Nicrophorus vespilloides]|uniref:Uncharacterized protein LOC108566309 n=1 Tax=Nicrophorus vespilloides TaxID=110193 RepID=A0ABM1N460_NICVS|nr:PREDICTED: uncharacterized protein LOC108566309 [Nicrophorus vespilloides]XP_017781610.1 PREDICTED: uncharacterized protein LOC108566309 [Nicrophorus vespilloides]
MFCLDNVVTGFDIEMKISKNNEVLQMIEKILLASSGIGLLFDISFLCVVLRCKNLWTKFYLGLANLAIINAIMLVNMMVYYMMKAYRIYDDVYLDFLGFLKGFDYMIKIGMALMTMLFCFEIDVPPSMLFIFNLVYFFVSLGTNFFFHKYILLIDIAFFLVYAMLLMFMYYKIKRLGAPLNILDRARYKRMIVYFNHIILITTYYMAYQLFVYFKWEYILIFQVPHYLDTFWYYFYLFYIDVNFRLANQHTFFLFQHLKGIHLVDAADIEALPIEKKGMPECY